MGSLVGEVVVGDRARLGAAVVAIAAVGLMRSPALLAATVVCVLIPIGWLAGTLGAARRLAVGVLLPMLLILLGLWGWLMGAPPGEARGSDPTGGALFALATVLRVGGIVLIGQAAVLGVNPEHLPTMFRRWGLRGDLLIAAMGAYLTAPELTRRANDILMARASRGLLPNRRFLTRLGAVVPSTLGLFTWAVTSAVHRARLWERRGVLDRVDPIASTDDAPIWRSAALLAAACALLTIAILDRAGGLLL